MASHTPLASLPTRVRAAWRAHLAAAGQRPGQRVTLLRHQAVLLPRFAAAYAQLQALPRQQRRRLFRRLQQSLASLALLLALGQTPALAATIAVDGTICTLADAITAANTDAPSSGCPAGSGAATLVLPPNSVHTLTAVNNGHIFYGDNGLPVITSAITSAGNGSTIQRASSAPAFCLFFVDAGGALTLQETTVSGGNAPFGGGVANLGTLTLARTLVSGNTAAGGPEIFNFAQFGSIVIADNHNLFGHDGAAGVAGFTPGSTDVVPSGPLSTILETTLANNGGPTQTYTYVWKTDKAWTGTCRQLDVQLSDGSHHLALFKFK